MIKLDLLPCLRISILVKPGQFDWSFGVLKQHSQTAQEFQRRKMTLIKCIRIVCKRWREKMNRSSVESLETACGPDWQLPGTDLAIFQTLHEKSLSFFFNLNCLFLLSFSLLFCMVNGISSCFLSPLLSNIHTLVYSCLVGGAQTTYFRQVFYHWCSPTHPVLEIQVTLLCPDPLRKCLLQANTDDLLELCFFRKASLVWGGYTEEGAPFYVCTQSRESSYEQWCLKEVKGWVGICGMDEGGKQSRE